MTTISAAGTSTSYTPAERATVIAWVSATSTDRDRSIAEATALHNMLFARATQLRERGDATWHAAEPISSYTTVTYPQGANKPSVLEHRTSSRIRVKLANLEIVALIVEEFSRAGAETRVEWALTEVTKRRLEREARIAAVGAAREIADDYAVALGERITRVVSISDGEQPHTFGGTARFAAMSADAAAPAEVTRAEITVSASVEGTFESA